MHSAAKICFNPGGSGVSVAIISSLFGTVLAKTERFAWQEDSQWKTSPKLSTFVELAVSRVGELLKRACCAFDDVAEVCISWPGPGDYQTGLLSATFIPGCTRPQQVHEIFREELSRAFSVSARGILIRSALDVSVRACGELHDRRGSLHEFQGSGLVLNIGTGIAGTCVRDGKAILEAFNLGSTYGQFGRYLFRNSLTGTWCWSPTLDGSVPTHSYPLVRLTRWCGGPALASRFAGLSASDLPPAAIAARERMLANQGSRQLQAEKILLSAVTETANADRSTPSTRFVTNAGADIGRAIRCLIDGTGNHDLERIVLTGGIGENFGAAASADADLFLNGIRNELPQHCSSVVRSTLGLDAEYVGWATNL